MTSLKERYHRMSVAEQCLNASGRLCDGLEPHEECAVLFLRAYKRIAELERAAATSPGDTRTA